MEQINWLKLKLIPLAILIFGSQSLVAGMIVLKGPKGEVYQINDNYKNKNGVRVTQIRWPDNKVDVIHISGCDGYSPKTLTRYDSKEKIKYETFGWSHSGGNLIDRVSTAVCKI
jgi:hypothetical protein